MEISATQSQSAQELIELLKLEAHDEGGYFRQIYESDWQIDTPRRLGGNRAGVNTIYYMLTAAQPLGRLHRNESDIIHFFHSGGPLRYLLLSPDGDMRQVVMGPDPAKGHVFQMTVPGGYWKASFLTEGDYGLISEAVVPGFDYRDRTLATLSGMRQLFAEKWDTLEPTLAPYIVTGHSDSEPIQ